MQIDNKGCGQEMEAKPICHLVWRQGRRAIDDVEVSMDEEEMREVASSALSASTSREWDRLPAGHIVLEQADLTDGRVSQTVRRPNGTEYERIVDGDEAYGSEE